MKPKVIFLPHANIQYSQLKPERREWVVKNCYEPLFDLVGENHYKIGFEASGKTLDEIQRLAPQVMKKLVALIGSGQVEPVASPYTHLMMGNVPRQIAVQTLIRSLDTWERYTGYRPKVGWNPECSWNAEIPGIYKEAGIETLIMDADSFFLSFPEIRKATGLCYDVQGHSNKNQLFLIEEYIRNKPEFLKYLTNPSVCENGLNLIFRSDCMANLLLWYLMGATEGVRREKISLEEIRAMFDRWKERTEETGTFLMPYAEDAEYIGSSAYFYVKQFNQARFFEEEPDSLTRFQEIVELAVERGFEPAPPSEVVQAARIIENPYIMRIENGVAWHGGTSKAWLNTEQALLLDPVCHMILKGIEEITAYEEINRKDNEQLEAAFQAVTEAWVSDARWPPAPTSPGRFNVREALDELHRANELVWEAMKVLGIEELRSLYSPDLMRSQLRFVEEQLMKLQYFEEQE